jgi:hypothetical protein
MPYPKENAVLQDFLACMGRGTLGTVVVAAPVTMGGIFDYEEFTINAGVSVTVQDDRPLVIRARKKITINGKIVGSGKMVTQGIGILQLGTGVFSGSGGGGGGGDGSGANGFPGQQQYDPGTYGGGGYFPGSNGTMGIGGVNNNPGADGGDGSVGTPGVISQLVIDIFSFGPSGHVMLCTGGAIGAPGMPGADGGQGGPGGIGPSSPGGTGGSGGAGGSAGSCVYLIAPEIEYGAGSQIDLDGTNGTNGTVGNPGSNAALPGAAGGGGGGGGAGGQGGNGGALVAFARLITDLGITINLSGGVGGAGGAGGAAGIGYSGMPNGGKGGAGAQGTSGSLGYAWQVIVG